MALLENRTPHAVEEVVGLDPDGADQYLLVVKASFRWRGDGTVVPDDAPQPVRLDDLPAGEPGRSSALLEGDLAPVKPRVDVLLAGRIALAAPVHQVDVALEVGGRIRKVARVFGDRGFVPGALRTLRLTDPRPFQEMPLAWERSFGGTDPEHPECIELRNPFGRGVRKHAEALEGQLAPNFEDPRRLLGGSGDRPAPVGFGPVGRFWEPRVRLAGTYDRAWQEERFPLPPRDLDPRFWNCAPLDQQLDGYLPGEEVRLAHMTPAGGERFRLPALEVPVTFVARDGRIERTAVRPDTVVVEPAERRVSLVGRVRHLPRPDVVALRDVIVGEA